MIGSTAPNVLDGAFSPINPEIIESALFFFSRYILIDWWESLSTNEENLRLYKTRAMTCA